MKAKEYITKPLEFVRGHKKPILWTALGLATLTGTFSGTEGGLPPFYNKKVGTSFGINLGCITRYMPGSKFYGISVFIGSSNEGGVVNGLNLGVINTATQISREHTPEVNGLEIAAANFPLDETFTYENKSFDGDPHPPIVNGVQVGLANFAKAGNLGQVGVYNSIKGKDGKVKRGFLINYRYRGRGR